MQFPPRLRPGKPYKGFTLVEVLVSLSVLVIVVVFTTQMLSETSRATKSSDQQMEASSAARIIFQSFGSDLNAALLHGGSTILFYNGASAQDSALGFLSQSRARFTSDAAVAGNLRGSIVGYRMRNFSIPVAGGNQDLRLLARGDGRLTYFEANATERASFDFAKIFETAGLPTDLSSQNVAADQTIVQWDVAGGNILRFHLSFLLDDGSIVQTPPRYQGFGQPEGGTPLNTGTCVPIAFSSATSSDLTKRYVKGIIVSLAALDVQSRDRALQAGVLGEMQNVLSGPPDGRTALDFWNEKLANLNDITKRSVRFYERTFPIN